MKYSNEKLFHIFKDDVMDPINDIYTKLIRLFDIDMELSSEEHDSFVEYWNKRVEKENAESEVISNE